MANSRLNVIDSQENPEPQRETRSQRASKRDEAKAKFERIWLTDPESFNPMRNAMERERIARTLELTNESFSASGKKIADLGCGCGTLTIRLSEQGALMHAVDIASNALKRVQEAKIQNVTMSQDYVPETSLQDNAYDAVICTDLIAYLDPIQYRLFFSELARLIHSQGYVICSTAVDIDSDALQRFAGLAETEFKIEKWILSYHALYIRLHTILTAPSRYCRAWKEPEFKQKELSHRKRLSRKWFQLNSSPVLAKAWSIVNYPLQPLVNKLEQSRSILIGLENICKFIWSDSGISHALFIGTRKPLIETPPEDTLPQERKYRKEVWE